MGQTHIIGLGFDQEVIIAPLRQYECDRLYILSQQPALNREFWRKTLFYTDALKDVVPNLEIVRIDCESNLHSLYEAINDATKKEFSAGNSVHINVSSGSRLFAAAGAIVASQHNVDLYYVQRSNYTVERDYASGTEAVITLPSIQPSVHKVDIDSTLCFMLMPFIENLNAIYEDVVKEVIGTFDLRCLRADDFFDNRPIMDDIWQSIEKARVVISDLTGRNPNVFYETGIAHAMGKEVILLTQDLTDVPFDLRHLRCIVYSDSVRGIPKLKMDLQNTLNTVLSRTSVTRKNK